MNIDDVKPGQRVIYIPVHANGNREHPDCEHGTVRSLGRAHLVFVHFEGEVTLKRCLAERLVERPRSSALTSL